MPKAKKRKIVRLSKKQIEEAKRAAYDASMRVKKELDRLYVDPRPWFVLR